ncbi:RES domain-containing protein [Thioflavicoccus mobilis 8321]|uniref:RES domain-containing protein n=1 Tax=Thioflavicoccus mobilis 8321 TaxID=765912 RepID=L0GZF2_9GAMM|nr:RES family NAD+ phosphorylase [Thioflavicoccus mobilis]AGA92138.1 RES domain-containing protein [Thioflavicoccus mobilis 8321]
MDLWDRCRERLDIAPLGGELLRMVESQQQVATSELVDDLTEQALLEDLIERSKPPRPAGTGRLHYLLATPFRYPPLRHGSRFGGRFEASLFYGARRLPTLLAEAAYYRFVFWAAMAAPPPSGRLLTQHSVFAARWQAARGVRLQDPPCADHEPILRDPQDYRATQRLGSALREVGVGAIEYRSARDAEGGINVALFQPDALVSRTPLRPQAWLCETSAARVRFTCPDGQQLHELPIEGFLIDGVLPRPAA